MLEHYTLSDVFRRVVGVGSVGTRCALTLMQDGDGNALILQAKQAGRSVLEQYGEIAQPGVLNDQIDRAGEGGRVVALQQILQAVSDPYLGYLQYDDPETGTVDFYVRQFHDMKGGIEAEEIDDEPFVTYARSCAITLARAHAQSPAAAVIAGYIGGGRRLGTVFLEWAYAYADRSLADYRRFIARAA